MVLATATGWGGFTDVQQWSVGQWYAVNGRVHRISSDMVVSNTSYGFCPLHVTQNVTSVIWIDRGKTVKLRGGDANGFDPSCAAIQFDNPNATLIIAGHGTLEVTGGNGGNAANGEEGEKNQRGDLEKAEGYKHDTYLRCGSGGYGGVGGGGASPGIGGRAGRGGHGGARTQTDYSEGECTVHGAWHLVKRAGNISGINGVDGFEGAACGTIYVIGTVTVKAAHGTRGKGGGGGVGGAQNDKAYLDYTGGDDYFVGSGGGGGGGAGGPQPSAAIGGGAGGGGGGGSGATGTTAGTNKYDHEDRYPGIKYVNWMIGGYGGSGGRSDTDEASGGNGEYGKSLDSVRDYWRGDTITISEKDEGYAGSRSPYPGGMGGLKGKNGDDGKIYIMSSAKVQNLVQGQSAYVSSAAVSLNETALALSDYEALPSAVKYKLTLQNSGSERVTHVVALGCKYPSIAIPTREHYVFQGYYAKPNRGGACYYDESGRWMLGDDARYYDIFGDQTLYAAWEFEGEPSESIEVKSGETLVVDELTGTAEYAQATDKPLFTVRYGGKLVLNNLTFYGNELSTAGIIRNFGEVVVSNCTFESCALRKGRGGVYRDFPGAQALFIRCSFVGCSAAMGGVIAASGSKVSILQSTFAYNSSLADISAHISLGAAVYSDLSAETHVCCCTFVGQTAASSDSGSVVAWCVNSEYPTKGAVLNNVFDMDESCKRSIGCPPTYACNFRTATSASADGTGEWCKTSNGAVTLATPRAVNGVNHTYFKVSNGLRTLGIAHQFYPQATWPNYVWDASGTGTPMFDILEEWPLVGYVGARSGNELQRLIDLTPPGGTLYVPSHIYDGVVIDKKITIIGENVSTTIVSGDDFEPCVQYRAGGENAVWVNMTFADGKGTTGGGWTSAGDLDRGIASNCVFRSCEAENGAGAANAKIIADSVFYDCEASGNGGGTYSCAAVYRSYYYANSAAIGGGAYGDTRTYSSLFQQNTAGSGGGVAEGDCSFCTFAKNAASTDATAGAYASRVYGCVFYGHPVPTDSDSAVEGSTRQLYASAFVNAKAEGSAADYHLALKDSSGEKLTHDDVRLATVLQGRGVLDFEGLPLVSTHPISGEEYLYAGCYAFAPFKTSGLVVTGTAETYPGSNAQSSLRETIESAEEFAPLTNGQMVVTFSPTLFEYDTTVCFPLTSVQIDLRAFTNVTLVVRGPTNKVAVVDGTKTSRAFRIFAQNRVIFENIVFQNCFGDMYGKAPQPGMNGGAVLNYGNAFFSNCVFRANRAGNRYATVPNEQAPVGFGGALSTESGATSTVYAATFAGNRAAKGGAVWTADGGASHIYYSTFAGNIADGDVVTDATGGACAQERKTSGVKGGDLWLVNCTLAGNRVTKNADSGGAISGAKAGLVLLNSVVVGNYAANATNDIALPAGSTSHFYYTAYGTRTPPPKTSYVASQITYVDLCSTGGVAYLDAIGLTNDMPVVQIEMPQTVLPLAKSFAVTGTNVWTTADYGTLGYGDTSLTSVQVLAGGSRYQLLKSGAMRTTNILGESQRTNGVVRLGPATVTGASLRGDDDVEVGGGTKPTYDDEDQVAATNGVCYLVKIDGSTNYYPSVETAVKHWQPGDYATVCSEEDEALNEKFFDAFDAKLRAYVEANPWYDYTYVGDNILKLALTLNEEKVTPTIHGDFDVTSTKDKVSVQIENVKPGLWYSLGRADSPEGPYVCEKWVQANDEGKLRDFLTASKSGDEGFYRVFVAPYVK